MSVPEPKQLPSGLWFIRFRVKGTPRRISKTFRTKSAANAWYVRQRNLMDKGEWKSPEALEAERVEAERLAHEANRTFGNYATSWLETRQLTPATRDGYRSNLRTHLIPKWGETPIRQITTPEVRAWVADELSPDHPGAREKAFELFKTIMSTAEDDEVIDRTPVKKNMLGAGKARAGKSQRHKPRALNTTELLAVADEVPAHMRVMVLLDATVGMRAGELRELRAKDVDFEEGTIMVSRAVTGDGKARTVGTPKTDAGAHVVVPPAEVMELLKEHMSHQMGGREALIFPSSRDPKKHMGLRTIQINIKRACERLGIDHASPHDFRHTAASMAGRTDGISPKDVQSMLGQSTPGMALRYMETDTPHQQKIARAVGAEVFGSTSSDDVTSLDDRRTGSDR